MLFCVRQTCIKLKKYRQNTIQKRFVRAVCGEVLLASGSFWLILILQYRHHYVHLTGTTYATSPVKVMGVNFPYNVSYSLANHNTPAQT